MMHVKEAVDARRARRVISSEPIGDEEVRLLLEAMRLSPSCNNNQPWNVIEVRGQEQLSSLKAALPRGNSWALSAPLILAVCSTIAGDCDLSDRRVYHLFDCGIAVGEMVLMATAMGLIAHPIAGYDPVKAKEVLGIPDEQVLITLVICGLPGSDDSMLSEKQLQAEAERPLRKPMEQNFFSDRWGQPFI